MITSEDIELIKAKKYDYTVLYAEDDDTIRKPMSDLLSFIFTKVITCNNGDIAFKEFKKNDVDLVLTDLAMPSSGIKLIHDIRVISKSIPIIVHTAYNKFNYIFKDIENIFVMVKPIEVVHLLNVIKAIENDILKNKANKNAYLKLKEVKEDAEKALAFIQKSD